MTTVRGRPRPAYLSFIIGHLSLVIVDHFELGAALRALRFPSAQDPPCGDFAIAVKEGASRWTSTGLLKRLKKESARPKPKRPATGISRLTWNICLRRCSNRKAVWQLRFSARPKSTRKASSGASSRSSSACQECQDP